ncbi:IPTL-CTERM sorting domain-containing protein [Ottowia thiooxydans]|uniref:DUF11 domain-containing protein n=1 Tax=Ottowia thiooxydans TaxID=219182 RepID=A0ABV2Q7Q8_9BURK
MQHRLLSLPLPDWPDSTKLNAGTSVSGPRALAWSRWLRAGVLLASLVAASGASAQSFLANKKFSSSQAFANGSVTLTFDLFNSRAETLSAGLQDRLPDTSPAGQLWFSTADNASASGVLGCTTGTVTFSDFLDAPANTKAQTVTITGAAVPAQPAGLITPNCQVSLPVHVGSVGTDSNVTNSVAEGVASASNANSDVFLSDAFSASLLIRAPVNPLVTSKSFTPAVIPSGGASTLQITINNNTSPAAMANNVAFTDNLPSGVTATGIPAFSGCGAPTSATTSGATTVVMTGGTIAAGATCTITVPVTAIGSGPLLNTIPVGGVTATGYSNTVDANGTLNVRDTIKMTKVIQSPGNSNQWRTDTLPTPGNLYGAATTFTQGAASATVNQPVPVRVYFSNPSGTALTGGALTDALPNGIVAVGGIAGGTCAWPGTAPTIPVGATSVSFGGVNSFNVPAANLGTGVLGSCYVEFWVKATSTFTNNTNALSTSNINFTGINSNNIEASTSATMNATGVPGGGAGAVTVEKRFYQADGTNQTGNTPIRVEKGEAFWMRVAVRNTVYDSVYTNGSVVDTLPLGLKVATPLNVRLLQNPPTGNQSYPQGCGNQTAATHPTDGGVSVSTVGGQDVITYSGWTLHSGAGSNNQTVTNQGCFYAIQLVSDATLSPSGGDYINTISANTVTASAGAQAVTNPSGVSARVIVRSDLDASKSFNPSTIGAAGGARTRLTISFNNKNAAVPITNLAVTDNLPSDANFGTLTVASPPGLNNTCGGTVTAVPGQSSVSLTGGTVAVSGTCSIEVDVLHSGGNGNPGSIVNTITTNGVTNDQNQSNNEAITATLTKGSLGVSVNKVFAASQALGGRAVKLTLNFSATSASTVAQNLITLTDNLPAGMEVAPNANISTTCQKQNGDPADVQIPPARNSFTISGFRFSAYSNGAAPHNSCAMSLDVILTTTGNKTNTIPRGAIGTDMGSSNASPSSATLSALANTALQKQFNPKRVEVGSPSTMTLTLVNVNIEARNDFSLTDTLPSGMVVAAGASSHTCGNGALTAVQGSGSVSITGGDVAANASCTITVPVTVTVANAYVNGPSNFNASNFIDLSQARDELEGYASSLRGTVFVDPDLNGGTTGFVPAADTGLGGVAMDLLRNGTVIASAVTATTDLAAGATFTNTVNGAPVTCTVPAGGLAAGQYLFCNLPSGEDYSVRQTQPTGYTSTGNKAGTAGGTPEVLGGTTEVIDGITVRPEENESGYDFGEYEHEITNVSGRVYIETGANQIDDGNGVDPGMITTVAITCTGPGDVPGYSNSMTTGADGTYRFTGMLPGAECTITETQPVDYSNAYTQTGMTGEPGVLGPLNAGEYGQPGDSVIASLVVPAAGSPFNNFAEIRLADMSSTTVCTPLSGLPGTLVSCTVTCTNAGPNSAENAFCSVPNAPALPGAPVPVCGNSPQALLGAGESLSCSLNFALPNVPGEIPVRGVTGADNDTNGGGVPTDGNNPSSENVSALLIAPVPTVGALALVLMGMLLAGFAYRQQRRRG